MKTINDFFHDISINKKLKKSFEKIESTEELCREAKRLGYNFTEEELIENYLVDISGGSFVDNTHMAGTITILANGNNNVQLNNGGITQSQKDINNPEQNLTKEDKMEIVLWALGRS